MSAAPPSTLSPAEAQEDISYQLTATIIVGFVLETVAVVMRILARRVQNTRLMWGDFLIPITYITDLGILVSCIYAIKLGDVGKHMDVVPFHKFKEFLIISHYPLPVFYAFASSLPKLAILEIYIRFFVLDRIPRYISYFTGAIIIANVLVSIPLVATSCQPVAALWDPYVEGHCIDTQKFFLWATFPNIVTDVIMLVLPLPTVWRMQSNRRVKWGILTTFLVGSVGVVFSVIRFTAFDHPWTDGTWIAVPTLMATIAEPGVYLLAACFLTFRPLWRYIANQTCLAPIFTHLSSAASAVLSSVSGGRMGSVDDGSIRGQKFAGIRFSSSTAGSSWNGSTTRLARISIPDFSDGGSMRSQRTWHDEYASSLHRIDSMELELENARPVSVQSGWGAGGQALTPMSPPEHDARQKDIDGHRAMSVGYIPSLRALEAGPVQNTARRTSAAV